ncbi:acylphosphatase-2-like [Babylonia areolata]|uniref:acylphosphatase-2-like n=1 Tax=Babylonia areolata TaxID=304850 RepID=UPI003FD20653
MSSGKFTSVEYEVFGRVQGVFFRKFTEETARERRCVGWVANTYHGTVRGVVQGRPSDVEYMKDWLEHTGSPMSQIHSVKFTNEKSVDRMEYSDFKIRH